MKMKKQLLILFFSFALISALGQQGCVPSQQNMSKAGLDFYLLSGIDYLSAGKILHLGDSFFVGVKIENYDKERRSGIVCIEDNVPESYGGIDKECRAFTIKEAEVKDSSLTPSSTTVYFPSYGEYGYVGIPHLTEPYSAKLFVTLHYSIDSRITGTVVVPGKETETIQLNAESQPIEVSATKSVRRSFGGYKVLIEIKLKRKKGVKIFSPEFEEENSTYLKVELYPYTLECKSDNKPIKDFIRIENERLIKCSGVIYPRKEESYPLIIQLKYGIALEKEYNFKIET